MKLLDIYEEKMLERIQEDYNFDMERIQEREDFKKLINEIDQKENEYILKEENLVEMLEEVKSQLELTNDYETKIKILKRYKILNKDGMLNV